LLGIWPAGNVDGQLAVRCFVEEAAGPARGAGAFLIRTSAFIHGSDGLGFVAMKLKRQMGGLWDAAERSHAHAVWQVGIAANIVFLQLVRDAAEL
jgi:hypothetical protein